MLHDPRYETKIKARAILNAAADYIEAHGWCQRALHMNGRVCLMGAINAASCGDPAGDQKVPGEIVHRLRHVTGTANIVAWNDTIGRTEKQVVRALRKAAQAG